MQCCRATGASSSLSVCRTLPNVWFPTVPTPPRTTPGLVRRWGRSLLRTPPSSDTVYQVRLSWKEPDEEQLGQHQSLGDLVQPAVVAVAVPPVLVAVVVPLVVAPPLARPLWLL